MRSPAGRPPVAVLGFSVLLAVVLGWCAVPGAVADMIVQRHTGVIRAAKTAGPVDPVALRGAADASARAARWAEPDRHLADAAAALLAMPRPAAGEARLLLGDVLAARPTDSRSWLRLAWARLPRDRAGARAAWTMAVATAPFDPPALPATLAIGFALLPTPDAAFVDRLARRVRLAARLDPIGLAQTARGRGAEAFVYASLLREPDLSWRFSLALALVSRPPKPSSVGAP